MNEQERKEWLDVRCGCIGASRMRDVCAKPKKGAAESSTRRNYKWQLVAERLTGVPEPEYISPAMEKGMQREPDARAAYEFKKDLVVDTCGFVMHPMIDRAGCSPDGLIGKDGLVQFKCPYVATHGEWLTDGRVPVDYIPQMQWEMACTGRQWSDFVSYCPQMPEHLRLFIIRLPRDAAKIEELEAEVRRFDAEVEEAIRHLPSGKTIEQQLQASIEAAPRKSKIHEAVSRAKEDPLEITQEDLVS